MGYAAIPRNFFLDLFFEWWRRGKRNPAVEVALGSRVVHEASLIQFLIFINTLLMALFPELQKGPNRILSMRLRSPSSQCDWATLARAPGDRLHTSYS